MRQGNQIEAVPAINRAKLFSDHIVKPLDGEELRDTQLADGNDQLRAQNVELAVTPIRAVFHFFAGGHPIAAFGSLARKASRGRRHVNLGSEFLLRQAN